MAEDGYIQIINSAGDLDSLLSRIAQGDTTALAQLYYAAGTSVYAYALSLLKNSHDAENVLHDCFVNIFTAAASYRCAGKPMAWILTIARNLCLKRLQERKRTAELGTEDWRTYLDSCKDTTADDKVVIRECMERLSDCDVHSAPAKKPKKAFRIREFAATAAALVLLFGVGAAAAGIIGSGFTLGPSNNPSADNRSDGSDPTTGNDPTDETSSIRNDEILLDGMNNQATFITESGTEYLI